MKTTLIRFGLLLALMAVTATATAQNYRLDDNETRAALSITADALLVRPVAIGMTALGTLAFTFSLPLTALTGSIDETAESWVRTPARHAFLRCLGCVEEK